MNCTGLQSPRLNLIEHLWDETEQRLRARLSHPTSLCDKCTFGRAVRNPPWSSDNLVGKNSCTVWYNSYICFNVCVRSWPVLQSNRSFLLLQMCWLMFGLVASQQRALTLLVFQAMRDWQWKTSCDTCCFDCSAVVRHRFCCMDVCTYHGQQDNHWSKILMVYYRCLNNVPKSDLMWKIEFRYSLNLYVNTHTHLGWKCPYSLLTNMWIHQQGHQKCILFFTDVRSVIYSVHLELDSDTSLLFTVCQMGIIHQTSKAAVGLFKFNR